MQENKHSDNNVSSPWMTIREVAEYLSVSPGTVKNWVSQRYIPFAKRGGVTRFHKDRIDRWLSVGECNGRLTIPQEIAVRKTSQSH